jgi:hypothetical protein
MRSLRDLKYWTKILLPVVGALILIDNASVTAEENLKATLQLRYNAMKIAMAAHNGPAINAVLAPDFTATDLSGAKQTASQMIAEVNDLRIDPNKVGVTTLVSVNPVGSAIQVVQQYEMKSSRVGTDGVAHSIKLVTLSIDTWVNRGENWLLQQTVTKEMTLFRDGRLVVHKVKS